jgi:hypothetical protein
MPKLTRVEISDHRQFMKRQQAHEERYLPFIFRYLNAVYNLAAKTIEENGTDFYFRNINDLLKEKDLERIYRKIYIDITLDEARIQNSLFNLPKMMQKDIIDDFASLIPFTDQNELSTWRLLLNDYINSRIGLRIVQVTQTTIKFVQKIISESIAAGDGALVTARKLREKTDFNKNRSLAIARTETVTAMNQGKYMAALSSKFEMEKRWIPANDKRTRHSHLEFLNSGFIPMESLFSVSTRSGGEDAARYPGDESLSAENAINCRCSISFRLKRNSSGNVITKI